jgi:hypothetical protein
VKYWVVPKHSDPVVALREWLETRLAKHPDPLKTPDLAHEPVILIRPYLGEVVWDGGAAPPPRLKTTGRQRPHGVVPP